MTATAEFEAKWQEIVDLLAEIAQIPAALIMRLEDNRLEVQLANRSDTNPYRVGEGDSFPNTKFFCEEVINKQAPLEIHNARDDPHWQGAPALALNMLSYLGFPISYPHGEPYGTLCILNNQPGEFPQKIKNLMSKLRDLIESDIKFATIQRRLFEDEKQTSLSHLVAGVTHDISTPLGIGITATSLIAERLNKLGKSITEQTLTKTQLEKDLGFLLDSAQTAEFNLARAAKLLQSFKQVTLDQCTVEKRTIRLKTYLEEVCHSLNSILKSGGHSVDITCPESLNFSTYPGLLAQVITNLITNSVSHGFKHKKEGKIRIEVTYTQEKVSIHFSDDGEGIAEEIRDKIFTPFFTTNKESGNSGLGMSIIQRIIEQDLHGSIQLLDSASGTHIQMDLPDQHRP